MALVKGDNSYATVAEADAYFEDRLDANAWANADATRKAQALVTATASVDSLDWGGTAVSESQKLSFPREGYYLDPKLGYDVVFGEANSRVLAAVYELALHLLTNEAVSDTVDTVESLSLGELSLTRIRKASRFPYTIKRHVACMLSQGGTGRAWWRAN